MNEIQKNEVKRAMYLLIEASTAISNGRNACATLAGNGTLDTNTIRFGKLSASADLLLNEANKLAKLINVSI